MTHYFRGSVLPCILTFFIFHADIAFSESQEHGRVNMQGSIIETPCAIATADREQTINMGAVTMGEIIHNGQGPVHKFSLQLVNCVLQPNNPEQKDWAWFVTTFDGPVQDGVFSVNGASGIGLEIADAAGHVAMPGQPMPGMALTAGEQQLDYTLRLTGNHHRLEAGEYHTVLRFKVDYF
ncbi:hypothetical protein CJP72_21170 [Citrobacter sp. NCU1]|uniref:fimbrial protein n=1 Tax=Citrobacter sp. NCU1 TaxID=2026683 RepID=UPI00139196F4|nr:fimbrial protein [Citrobacter sp. NCU1]NDO83188.1 hypothetical protein [Citrobacter sp. NCU1]